MKAEEERLAAASRQLQAGINAFRQAKDAAKAAHTTAEEAAQFMRAELRNLQLRKPQLGTCHALAVAAHRGCPGPEAWNGLRRWCLCHADRVRSIGPA